MRVADILNLAVAALRQQKARTCLTTLGVVFGSFTLAASLSVGQAGQDLIRRESRRNTHLREIEVHPDWQPREREAAAERPQVAGAMTDARRQRLGKALALKRNRFTPAVP